MDAAAPEIRAVEIVALLVAQPVLDVLADEGRPKVARCLEAVDHRRRGREELGQLGARRRFLLFGVLQLADVAPRTDHLQRFAAFIADEMLLVLDPAIGVILPSKAVFQCIAAGLEGERNLGLYSVEVVGMDAVAPEGWIFKIILRRISE